MDVQQFKQCPMCGTWFTVDDIIHSPEIAPIGMMAQIDNPEKNFFFFNHLRDGCHSTFAVSAEKFAPFITETVPEKVRFGEDVCPGHCASLGELAACQTACRWAPYRRFLLDLVKIRDRAAQTADDETTPVTPGP